MSTEVIFNDFKDYLDKSVSPDLLKRGFISFKDNSSLEVSDSVRSQWHNNIDLRLLCKNGKNTVDLHLKSSPVDSGCGLVNIYGYSHNYITSQKENNAYLIQHMIKYYKFKKAGALFTTIGQGIHPSYVDVFKENGFKEITRYLNPLHGTGYIQSLLLLEL